MAATRFSWMPPGRKNDWLVNCGDENAVNFTLKPFLRAQGVNHVPRLVLTHGDLRSCGGAELLNELFGIGEIYTSPARFRSKAYREIVAEFDQPPRRHRILNRGDTAGCWQVLHPDATDDFAHADDASLVFLGNFHGTRVLLLSDLGRDRTKRPALPHERSARGHRDCRFARRRRTALRRVARCGTAKSHCHCRFRISGNPPGRPKTARPIGAKGNSGHLHADGGRGDNFVATGRLGIAHDGRAKNVKSHRDRELSRFTTTAATTTMAVYRYRAKAAVW